MNKYIKIDSTCNFLYIDSRSYRPNTALEYYNHTIWINIKLEPRYDYKVQTYGGLYDLEIIK